MLTGNPLPPPSMHTFSTHQALRQATNATNALPCPHHPPQPNPTTKHAKPTTCTKLSNRRQAQPKKRCPCPHHPPPTAHHQEQSSQKTRPQTTPEGKSNQISQQPERAREKKEVQRSIALHRHVEQISTPCTTCPVAHTSLQRETRRQSTTGLRQCLSVDCVADLPAT